MMMLDHLPKHVLTYIFSFVSSQEDLFRNVSKTCSMFCECVYEPELWQNRSLFISKREQHLLAIKTNNEIYRQSTFASVHNNIYGIELGPICIPYHNLIQFLYETNCRNLIIDCTDTIIVYNGGEEEEAEEENIDFENIIQKHLKLESMKSSFPVLPSSFVNMLASDRLHTLMLVNFKLNSSVLQFPAGAQLIELVLFHARIKDRELTAILAHCGRMKTIRLVACDGVSHHILSSISNYCKDVECLQIDLVVNHDDFEDTSTSNDTDKNQQLQLPDNSLDFHAMNHLKSLRLDGLPKETVTRFLELSVANPLFEFGLAHCDLFEYLSDSIMDKLSHIERFTIGDQVFPVPILVSLLGSQVKYLKLIEFEVSSVWLRDLHHVEQIEFDQCSFSGNNLFKQVCKLPNIQHIYLFDCFSKLETTEEQPLLDNFELGALNLKSLTVFCSCIGSQTSVVSCDDITDICINSPDMTLLSTTMSSEETADFFSQLSWHQSPHMHLEFTLFLQSPYLYLCIFQIASINLLVGDAQVMKPVDYFDNLLLIAICLERVSGEIELRIASPILSAIAYHVNRSDLQLYKLYQARLDRVCDNIMGIDYRDREALVQKYMSYSLADIRQMPRSSICILFDKLLE